ncbi:MAG: DUF2721 domain-containing protein [Ignavibacteria bacterium]|nr:DUF2721 domain-containing protein [Ignavibacteria bacterium]
MQLNSEFIVKMIQFMLAPAVMISACGLLLLGINNRYSSIANRIRLLNDERRRLILKIKDGKELDYLESNRLASLKKQLEQLFCRLGYVKNCVVFYSTGIFLFVLTSFLIGLDLIFDIKSGTVLMMISFISGMISVGIGILFALKEIIKGHKVIEIEIKAEE